MDIFSNRMPTIMRGTYLSLRKQRGGVKHRDIVVVTNELGCTLHAFVLCSAQDVRRKLVKFGNHRWGHQVTSHHLMLINTNCVGKRKYNPGQTQFSNHLFARQGL